MLRTDPGPDPLAGRVRSRRWSRRRDPVSSVEGPPLACQVPPTLEFVLDGIHADIPVVILCGGMGTRLREASEKLPKPLVDIGGKPILWHIMKLYSQLRLPALRPVPGLQERADQALLPRLPRAPRDFTLHMGDGHGRSSTTAATARRGLGGHLRRDRSAQRDRRAHRRVARLPRRATPSCSPTATASATSTSTRCSRATARAAALGTVTAVHPAQPLRRDAGRPATSGHRVQREADARRRLGQRRVLRLRARVHRQVPRRRPGAAARARAAAAGSPPTAS